MSRYDVVVVDDELLLARGIAQHLRLATKLSVTAVSRPDEALAAVAAGGVRVAVLDQKMPEVKGLELFVALRATDDLVRAVMLTDKATPQEVAEALELGFGAYVEKQNFASELAARVMTEYVAYEAELERRRASEEPPIVGRTRQGRLFRRDEVTYQILRYAPAEELTVFNHTWKTDGVVRAGQKKTVRRSVENVVSYRQEDEWNQKLTFGLGLDPGSLAALSAKIEDELTSRFRTEFGIEAKSSVSEETEDQLVDESADPRELRILSREYQSAPAYLRVRIIVGSHCSCCRGSRAVPLEVFHWTGRIATRHIEFWSDGSVHPRLTSVGVVEQASRLEGGFPVQLTAIANRGAVAAIRRLDEAASAED